MSIIIVGVGNDGFEAMDELDSDKYRLTAMDGRKAERDIVQVGTGTLFLVPPVTSCVLRRLASLFFFLRLPQSG